MRKTRIRRIVARATALLMAGVMLGGCAEVADDEEKTLYQEEVIFENSDNKKLEDKKLLYDNDDETSVITMYLTVSRGNEAENTNHTWEEINTYSVYDYDEMGVERYAVNGLLQVGDENGPLEGELGYGQYVPNATVTIRGQTSSRYARKNYKIELKDGKGKWNDQRVINLNKHQQDGVRFRNKLCFDLLKEMPGMISLKTQFVHLYVKDETKGESGGFVDYGIYTQVEQPNKSFLKRHGLDKNGQLYKINFFEFFRYEDVIMLKSDADYNEKAFEELIEIKGSDDHSKLIAMLEELNDTSIPIADVLDKWFEKDNLFSWLAFQILTGNTDTESRNTLLYSPLNTNTWYFISWDCDAAFYNTESTVIEYNEEVAWQKGISNYWGNVLFNRILKEESLRQELDDKIQEFRAILTEEKLQGMVESYTGVIKPYVYADGDVKNAPLTPQEYDTVCKGIPKEIEENYHRYLENLEEPMPFFIGIPEKTAEGMRFIWDNSYDFDSETITYTLELSQNYDMSNPIYVETDMLLPEAVYKGDLKPGQYFVRIEAENESGKKQYAFDYYVSDGSVKNYGIKCFYVMPDGTIQEDIYEE